MFIKVYIITWLILSLIWIILLIKERKNIILFRKDYVLYILKFWKLVIFLIALILLCLIANLWLDPSWDIPMTIIMSMLTYYTAPYSIWIIYRYIKFKNISFKEFYLSLILLFFSSAWIYDAYATIFLLWFYPEMAFSNLLLSPFFYIFAWMIWNLDYSKNDWLIFTYTKENWVNYKWDKKIFSKIFIFILPIIIFMLGIFWYFIYLNI